ncbi:ORC1-type DNA replication protein [Saccharolobus caldissimus]|uniref:ORC1-type DNA replication protein n=1 Tax=Saccharolobus caldissimus TaxID=1702097 RepID=A0AAQ4CPH4_9CREN|nr:ORC1-type DNA replication protein [Saccharolobus caldissimus]BDB97705.1 cell division control protein Cdc6 [Saccharolobus caldissimus]
MVSTKDILSDTLRSPVLIIKHKDKLSPDYVPNTLPHREDKIRELGYIFKSILTGEGKDSERVVIVGRTGTGKTATVKSFGKSFEDIAEREFGVKIKYVHINCYRHRTLYLISQEIANALKLPIPMRGLSAQEVFKIIHEYLDRRNLHILVTLDEFSHFLNTTSTEEIYFLVRLYDEISVIIKRISYIFIVNDMHSIYKLDKSIRDHIVRRVIEFPPYTSNELYDILKARVDEAFNENSVDEEALRYIANTYGFDKGGSGNARIAIETLGLAGEIAEKEGSSIVLLDHAKRANSMINPEVQEMLDSLLYLDLHQLILLKALIRLLNRSKAEEVTMGNLENEYIELSHELGEEPRKHTQVYEYLRKLKVIGIVNTRQSGKGMRGRTTLVSLSLPLDKRLDDFITQQILVKLKSKI